MQNFRHYELIANSNSIFDDSYFNKLGSSHKNFHRRSILWVIDNVLYVLNQFSSICPRCIIYHQCTNVDQILGIYKIIRDDSNSNIDNVITPIKNINDLRDIIHKNNKYDLLGITLTNLSIIPVKNVFRSPYCDHSGYFMKPMPSLNNKIEIFDIFNPYFGPIYYEKSHTISLHKEVLYHITETISQMYLPVGRLSNSTQNHTIFEFGHGINKNLSVSRLISYMEAIERYSWSLPEKNVYSIDTIRDTIIYNTQIHKYNSEYFILAENITGSKKKFLPYDQVIPNYPRDIESKLKRDSFELNISGTSAHFIEEKAIEHAVLEAIEKDTIMRNWYNNSIKLEKINTDSVRTLFNDEIEYIQLKTKKLLIGYRPINNFLHFFTILCIFDTNNTYPRYVTTGSSIGQNHVIALHQALKEAILTVHGNLKGRIFHKDSNVNNNFTYSFYTFKENIKKFELFVNAKFRSEIDFNNIKSNSENIKLIYKFYDSIYLIQRNNELINKMKIFVYSVWSENLLKISHYIPILQQKLKLLKYKYDNQIPHPYY